MDIPVWSCACFRPRGVPQVCPRVERSARHEGRCLFGGYHRGYPQQRDPRGSADRRAGGGGTVSPRLKSPRRYPRSLRRTAGCARTLTIFTRVSQGCAAGVGAHGQWLGCACSTRWCRATTRVHDRADADARGLQASHNLNLTASRCRFDPALADTSAMHTISRAACRP
jgi:hypothetical protein